MKIGKSVWCIFLSVLFLAAPFGTIIARAPGGVTPASNSFLPTSEYDFENRKSPINILVYTEYADLSVGGEYDNTMASILETYGQRFEFTNLTHSWELGKYIHDFDILLILEQEAAGVPELDNASIQWSGILPDWVAAGGIVICMGYWEDEFATTFKLVNQTGLMELHAPVDCTSTSASIVNSTNPLAFGVPDPFTLPDGSVGFGSADGVAVASVGADAVIIHKIFGQGHVVTLGFDNYERTPATDQLLANAIRLTNLVIFDYSHGQDLTLDNQLQLFGQQLTSQGFAVMGTNHFVEDILNIADVIVILSLNSVSQYTAEQVSFLQQYVTNGGGLFVASDWTLWGESVNPIVEGFGFSVRLDDYCLGDSDENDGQPSWPVFNNIQNHSITLGVHAVTQYAGTGITELPDGAVALVWSDSDTTSNWTDPPDMSNEPALGIPIASCRSYGQGRFFLITDTNMLDGSADVDGDLEYNYMESDNEIITTNAVLWLSAASIPEKTVLFDECHNPIYSITGGQYLECARLLTLNGFTVHWVNHFSPELILTTDILVIVDGDTNYTAPEIAIIKTYVQTGGSLFLMADWGMYGREDATIAAEFGLIYNTTSYIDETDDLLVGDSYNYYDGDNIVDHPINHGVNRIEIDRGGGFASIGLGQALLRTDTDGTATWHAGGIANNTALFAVAAYNYGRVIMTSDINFFTIEYDGDADGYYQLYDSQNDVFTINAFYWLIENRAPSVIVSHPNGGEVLSGDVTITWNALDMDGDTLQYDLYYSDNGGSNWHILANGLPTTQFAWNTRLYADGTNYLIRLVVSDGSLIGSDISDDVFSISNAATTSTTTTSTTTTSTTTTSTNTTTGTNPALNPMLLVAVGAGAVILIFVILIFVKRQPKS